MPNFFELFIKSEKCLKNGFYLDYFFKNAVFHVNKAILGNNFIYLTDKYLTEKLFFLLKNFFSFFQVFVQNLKNLNFKHLLKLILVISVQIIILIIL